ncbi:MAG: hypothetical protein GXP18_02850 [Gammaproteobacteria bacterium]|nr:hypothetical protein [Gammaproteobacteria bacterium]
MDAKIEYLKMIQAVISRMSHYGFLLKGWGVTLLAAILALATNSTKAELLLLVALLPVIVFWLLDAFFLNTEHKYRALYEQAAKISAEENVNFSLASKGEHTNGVKSVLRLAMSQTLIAFWGALLCVLLVAYWVVVC